MPKEAKIVHEVFLDQSFMYILEILLISNQFQYENEDYSTPSPPQKKNILAGWLPFEE